MSDASSDSVRQERYVVVARRYRPQGFAELIGQEHVASALTNAIETNRVGHAYLFTGARGTGKTSAARILARALNCEQGPTPSPCGKCDACQATATGDDTDVLEIDGASNRGIDEIRQLRSNVTIRPSRSRFKIYIIDEVHMLTTPAFNALLKTLEEPPSHVKFIFCTTDPEKMPITVLSRCQRFDFAAIKTPAIVARLQEIAACEQVEVETDALRLIARRANGSMRDSQSLLEQLLSFGVPPITVEQAHRMLGTVGAERFTELLKHLQDGRAAEALTQLDAAMSEGADAGQVVDQLLGVHRDILTASLGGPPSLMLYSGDDDYAELQELGRQAGAGRLLAALQILDTTLTRMKLTTQPRILAEMAIVRLARLEDLDSLASLLDRVDGGGDLAVTGTGRSQPAAARPTGGADSGRGPRSSAAPRAAAPAATEPPATERARPAPVAEAAAPPPEEPESPTPAPAAVSAAELDPGDLDKAREIWRQALADLSDMTSNCAAPSRVTAISAPNALVITFPAGYTSRKAFCEEPVRREALENAVSRAAGGKVRLEFAVEAGEPSQPQQQAAPAAPSKRRLILDAQQHEFVQTATDLFGGTVSHVEPPRKPR
jgi:DNA polymerase-3 subunit gamma/tau